MMWNLERRYLDQDYTEWQFMSKYENENDAKKAMWIAEEKHESRSRYQRGEIFIFRIILRPEAPRRGLIADRPRS